MTTNRVDKMMKIQKFRLPKGRAVRVGLLLVLNALLAWELIATLVSASAAALLLLLLPASVFLVRRAVGRDLTNCLSGSLVSLGSLYLYTLYYMFAIIDCGNANNLLNLSNCDPGTHADLWHGLLVVVAFNLYLVLHPILRRRTAR